MSISTLSIWTHPKTNETRVYCNSNFQETAKVWLVKSENEKFEVCSRGGRYDFDHSALVALGVTNQHDFAGYCAEMAIEQHGLDRNASWSEIIKSCK